MSDIYKVVGGPQLTTSSKITLTIAKFEQIKFTYGPEGVKLDNGVTASLPGGLSLSYDTSGNATIGGIPGPLGTKIKISTSGAISVGYDSEVTPYFKLDAQIEFKFDNSDWSIIVSNKITIDRNERLQISILSDTETGAYRENLNTNHGRRPDLGNSNSWSPCFLAGTPILLPDGSSVPIETIRPGDSVASFMGAFDFDGAAALAAPIVPGHVVRLLGSITTSVIAIHYESDCAPYTIYATPLHVMLTGSGRWMQARDALMAGERFVAIHGRLVAATYEMIRYGSARGEELTRRHAAFASVTGQVFQDEHGLAIAPREVTGCYPRIPCRVTRSLTGAADNTPASASRRVVMSPAVSARGRRRRESRSASPAMASDLGSSAGRWPASNR